MIRKLSIVLMLLVLIPITIALVSSDDWDGDSKSNINDEFPMDFSRTGDISDGTETFDSAIHRRIHTRTSIKPMGSIKLFKSDKDWMDIGFIARPVSNQDYGFVELIQYTPTDSTLESYSYYNWKLPAIKFPIPSDGIVTERNKYIGQIFIDNNKVTLVGIGNLRQATKIMHQNPDQTERKILNLRDDTLVKNNGRTKLGYTPLDIEIVDSDGDNNFDLVVLAEFQSLSTNFAGTGKLSEDKFILIFEGTGRSPQLFWETPTIYKVPSEINDLTFIKSNGFIYTDAAGHLKMWSLTHITNEEWKKPDDIDGVYDLTAIATDGTSVWEGSVVTSGLGNNKIEDISKDYILTSSDNKIRIYNSGEINTNPTTIIVDSNYDVIGAKFGFFNDDDKIDIATITATSFNVQRENLNIWYGEDSGYRKEEVGNNIVKGLTELAIGDLDQDGDEDIIYLRYGSSVLEWLENPGTPPDPPEDGDRDGDGVADSQDACPGAPQGAYGSEGCPDTDDDGILDKDDDCPTLDEGANGSDGCPDADDDGVTEPTDNCPMIKNSNQNDQNQNGVGDVCEDSDGDNINDNVDICPNEDSTGYDINTDGCIDDSDGDGVNDKIDVCPNTPLGEEIDQLSGCGKVSQKSKIVISSNTKVGVPITGVIRNLGEDSDGDLSYFNKKIEIVYWFNGIKENKKIIDSGENLICAKSLEATDYCNVYKSNRVDITINYSEPGLVEEGLDCSCNNPGDFKHNIPTTFKLNYDGVSKQKKVDQTFFNIYHSLNECEISEANTDEEGNSVQESATCEIKTLIFYEDKSNQEIGPEKFTLRPADASDDNFGNPTNEKGDESPYGILSQSCEYGNTQQRIDGSEWCCTQGYIAKAVGVLESLNPNEEACISYENKIPNAVISTNVTNISIGDTILFDASTSSDSDGIIKEYSWIFGDKSARGKGVIVEHEYEAECEQNPCAITLYVKDNFNNIGSDTILLNMTKSIVSDDKEADKEDDKEEEDDSGTTDDGTGGGYDWGAPGGGEDEDEDDGTKGSAVGWLIILAILAILGGAYFAFKKGIFSKKKEPEPIDLDSETFEAEEPVKEKKDTGKMSGFISDQQDKGLSNEEIRQKLLGKGLSDDEVDKHMNASRE